MVGGVRIDAGQATARAGTRQRARCGESWGDPRSPTFPAFPCGQAWAAMGRGRTRAECQARSGALPPRARSKKGLMMQIFLASPPTGCVATSCPYTRQKHEAENLLKTKGRKRAFLKNEAEN